jgi:hypothetical protein
MLDRISPIQWWFLISSSVGTIIFITLVIRELRIINRLQRSGITTKARVVSIGDDLWIGAKNLVHYIGYEFDVFSAGDAESDHHYRLQSISRVHYNRLSGVKEVFVCYMPQNPTISRLWDRDKDNARLHNLVVFGFLALLILVLTMSDISRF